MDFMRTNAKTLVLVSFFVALFVAVLSGFLSEKTVVLTTDAAIAGSDQSIVDVFSSASSGVTSQTLLGTSFSPVLPGFNGALKGLFSSRILWNNWSYSLGCLLASVVFVVFWDEGFPGALLQLLRRWVLFGLEVISPFFMRGTFISPLLFYSLFVHCYRLRLQRRDQLFRRWFGVAA